MSTPKETSRAFIEAQIEQCQPVIQQAKIMQMAWQAGGEIFKDKLEDSTKQLGAWLAVEESLNKQLSELE